MGFLFCLFSLEVLCGSLTSVGIIKLHCLEYPLVLVILSCYKNVIKETAYQQQEFSFHKSEGREVQDHSASRFGI